MTLPRRYRFRRLNEHEQPPVYGVFVGRVDLGHIIATTPRRTEENSLGRFEARPHQGTLSRTMYPTRVEAANALIFHIERGSR